MQKSQFAVIGLGVMGTSLALNVESRGYSVSVYNRDHKKTEKFLKTHKGNFQTGSDYKTFLKTIERPRKILIMVKAGAPIDYVIADILPHLNKGDIVIDGGNSHYKDTQRREAELQKKGIHFVGMGVSGGEEGARKGPSLMPGGSKEAWKALKPMLTKIAAKDFSEKPCVTHIGANGAGHYVKMVHNGIEYGIMQLMAETYSLLRKGYKLSAPQISDIFKKFNRGKLNSFLFEIAVPVLSAEDKQDKDNCCLIYRILDKASNKGTGKWASIDALDRGVAVPTITQAVYARYISTEKQVRTKLNAKYPHQHNIRRVRIDRFTHLLENALYTAIISTFAQGYDLIEKTAKEENWNINMAEVSRIWQGGCIIRAKLLKTIHQEFNNNKKRKSHLFLLPNIEKIIKKQRKALQEIVTIGSTARIAVPGFASSLSYIDAMTEERLPANFIQGLRDYFGAHTYERIDQHGSFHTNWNA